MSLPYASGRGVTPVLWVSVLCMMVLTGSAAEPNVGSGTYNMWLSSTYLLPSQQISGRMATITQLHLDHAYHQEYLDNLPPADAQTLLSIVGSCYNVPCLDLAMESSYTNVPISAGVTVGAQMQYQYVAYKKLAVDLPSDVHVPLVMAGYVSASLTDPGEWDYARADASIGALSGDINLSVGVGSGYSGSNRRVDLAPTQAYVWPDWAYYVTLQTAANLAFGANDPTTGGKGMQAFADPNIHIDPTATIDVNGTIYNATDLFGIAFSPGFHVASRAWTGGSTSGDSWSDGSNWSPAGAPASTDTLVFSGNTRPNPFNNLTNQQVSGLSFIATAGEFHLGGSALKIAGRIDNQSTARQEIDLPVEFVAGADSGKVNVISEGTLKITQPVSGNQGLTKMGLGTLEFTQDAAYTGDTTVEAGTLILKGLSNSDSTTVRGTLAVDHIQQDALTINAGGKVSVTGAGTSVVNFLNIADPSGNFTWEVAGGGISPNQNAVAAPEPAAWLLAVIAAWMGMLAWRRRK